MNEPAWLREARPKCPTEAAALDEVEAKLNTLEPNASTEEFMRLYEQMLAARTRLYDTWIAQESDT